jgi:hypothetical protein
MSNATHIWILYVSGSVNLYSTVESKVSVACHDGFDLSGEFIAGKKIVKIECPNFDYHDTISDTIRDTSHIS